MLGVLASADLHLAYGYELLSPVFSNFLLWLKSVKSRAILRDLFIRMKPVVRRCLELSFDMLLFFPVPRLKYCSFLFRCLSGEDTHWACYLSPTVTNEICLLLLLLFFFSKKGILHYLQYLSLLIVFHCLAAWQKLLPVQFHEPLLWQWVLGSPKGTSQTKSWAFVRKARITLRERGAGTGEEVDKSPSALPTLASRSGFSWLLHNSLTSLLC